MSELNQGFFARLAQRLPGMKRQLAETRAQRRAASNGSCATQPPCGICGKFFGSQKLCCGNKQRMFCPACQSALDKGCAAFVTLEKPARFWLGRGVRPELAGKVTVVSTEQMDAVLRAEERLSKELGKANIPSTGQSTNGIKEP